MNHVRTNPIVVTHFSNLCGPLPPMQAVSLPNSNAFLPRYDILHELGNGQNKLDDATATLMLTVSWAGVGRGGRLRDMEAGRDVRIWAGRE